MRHRIGRLADLPDGRGHLVELEGREIAVFRRGDRVWALDNVCPHRGAALAFGEVQDGVVWCPVHAWPFELATGRCADRDDARVDTFRVTVEGEDVLVEL